MTCQRCGHGKDRHDLNGGLCRDCLCRGFRGECNCSLSNPFKAHGGDPAKCPLHGTSS